MNVTPDQQPDSDHAPRIDHPAANDQREAYTGQSTENRWESPTAGESIVVPVIEEQVRIGKRVVETGKVRVIKKVNAEAVTVDVPVAHETVDVERVPINQYLDTAPPGVRYEGDTMIIPVLREEVVVTTRLVLVEEIRVTKRQVEQSAPQTVTLRKEEIAIERIDNALVNSTTGTTTQTNDLLSDSPNDSLPKTAPGEPFGLNL